jgi:hypothetical protein
MRYGPQDMTNMMGIGNYVGEMRRGPDGQVYQWVEGVDGLGNPIGFWTKAVKAVGKVGKAVRGGLVYLIPRRIKNAARSVCSTIDQLGPAVQQIPQAAPHYAAASGFCRVLRGAGIAGVGEEAVEIPEAARQAAASIPAPVKGVARKVCGFVDQLTPIVRFIPPVSRPLKGLTTLCKVLRDEGVAGVGEIMQAPDGQLYEVVEGIGDAGMGRRALRPIWLSIPATIRPRRMRRGVRPVVPVTSTVPAKQPGAPVRPVAPPPMASSVGRFR